MDKGYFFFRRMSVQNGYLVEAAIRVLAQIWVCIFAYLYLCIFRSRKLDTRLNLKIEQCVYYCTLTVVTSFQAFATDLTSN